MTAVAIEKSTLHVLDSTGGQEVSVLCVHPSLRDHEDRGYLPTEDTLVAQVLALKVDETEVVQTANVHRGRRHLIVA